MRKIIYASTAAMVAAALLAGCSSIANSSDSASSTTSATTSTDTSSVTIQDIVDANDLATLVANHGAVTMNVSSSDESVTATSTYYFYNDEDGNLQMKGGVYQNDGETSDYYIEAKTKDGTSAFYFYDTSDESAPGLQVLSGDDMDKAINVYHLTTDDGDITDISYQDDAMVVTTKTEYEDEDNYAEHYYYCDPNSLELYSISYTYHYSYDDDDGNTTSGESNLLYSYSYGEDEEIAEMTSAADAAWADDDSCVASIIINPGTEAETTQTFSLKKGATIYDVGYTELYNLYSDANLTEMIDSIDTEADEVTVYASSADNTDTDTVSETADGNSEGDTVADVDAISVG